MARIRSIYPTTPTDPDFALLPVEARLLFIYSWTIADDAGNLERNPLGLKMALFPADEWAIMTRIGELVDSLVAGRFYEPYEADGKQYLHIRTFSRYQKPDHPTAPRFPLVPGQHYTYEVRQGKDYVKKTVSGTLPERKVNVLTGKELELERRGKELDLEGTGEDGRGVGREVESALPSPPSGGGGVKAQRRYGKVGFPPTPHAIPGNVLSKATPSDKGNADFRIAAVKEAIARVEVEDWTVEKAIERLVNVHGFTEDEAKAALGGLAR